MWNVKRKMEFSSNNIYNYMPINSDIVSAIIKIYESYGRDKQAWINLLSLTNQSNSISLAINFFNQKIMSQPWNPLTLDIIDFLIDFGNINTIREISNADFMKNVFSLLKKMVA